MIGLFKNDNESDCTFNIIFPVPSIGDFKH